MARRLHFYSPWRWQSSWWCAGELERGWWPTCFYSASMWAIIGGIIGARLLHVIDFWDEVYQQDFIRIFRVWEGGIAIFGAISGGFVGGSLYLLIRNSNWFLAIWRPFSFLFGEPNKADLPRIGHLADVTAPALLVAMAIGRIGDIINGEHFAKITDLPWGVIYTHPDSPGVGASAPLTRPWHMSFSSI